jgi:peptide/nickel transport system ATP-binding protein
VVSRYSDEVIVMYAGQIAESASTREIFERPLHPYTRGLMSAFPSVRGPRRPLIGIPGAPPDLARPPSGCLFNPRCPEVMPECLVHQPELYPVGDDSVRCLLYLERAAGAGVSGG